MKWPILCVLYWDKPGITDILYGLLDEWRERLLVSVILSVVLWRRLGCSICRSMTATKTRLDLHVRDGERGAGLLKGLNLSQTLVICLVWACLREVLADLKTMGSTGQCHRINYRITGALWID